jgi:NADH:ubiquinone oxidoreductase subunit 6 (subunit J)
MNHEAFGLSANLFAFLDWHEFFFLLFAGVACVAAVMVVLSDNVVRMALHLVLSLGATAGLFFLAGAEFVGGMQLMIYVGGTLVLLVFGVAMNHEAFGLSANLFAFLDWHEFFFLLF